MPSLAYNQSSIPEHYFVRALRHLYPDVADEDFLASVHRFLQRELLWWATRTCRSRNLVFTGGCALNIKWNSALSASGAFADVWVPPFPNDAGSAFGAASAHEFTAHFRKRIEWNVYRGPRLGEYADVEGWFAHHCSIQDLAGLLANEPDEPVVFLYGRAELGPRALGHRSIFMNPTNGHARFRLNVIKRREEWRPVAPIVLEEDAPRFFSPGTRDPYMLFDHVITEHGAAILPAIRHIDNTARIQTVGADGCVVVRRLLEEFKQHTGVGALCNTSANLNGCGFFPDVESALRWGGANYVWADGTLYTKKP